MSKHPNRHKVTNKNRENRISNEIYDDKISLFALYLDSDILIEDVEIMQDSLHIYARCSLNYGACSYCGYKSHNIQYTYAFCVRFFHPWSSDNPLSVDSQVLLP